jgi:hypothetical protein
MFISFQFSEAERKYHTTEREFLCLLRALEESRSLIVGSAFVTKVYTDHSAIIHITKNGATAKGRLAAWLYRIGEFDIDIRHVPSKDLKVADGLSRLTGYPSYDGPFPNPEPVCLAINESGLNNLDR